MRSMIAVTAAAMLIGCGPDWPGHATIVADRTFVARPAVSTVDVLPIDLEMWTQPGLDVANLEETRSGTEARIANVVLDTLASRGYTTAALIHWDGNADGKPVMARDDVGATIASLAGFGARATTTTQLPMPFIPVRLGATTGSDATLFVGGWSYVAMHGESTGDKIAKGVAIGLIIVLAIAVIVLLEREGHHGGHHGGGGDGGGRGLGCAFAPHHDTHLALAALDAFGRAAEVAATDWPDDPKLPHDGDDPQMYLEITLVDNHSGLALWHAHQQFPASALVDADVDRVAHTLIAGFPARR